MNKHDMNKLELVLVTPDAIEVWNTVIKARGLYFILSYKTKTPTLYVGTKDMKPEPFMWIDTRQKYLGREMILNPDASIGVADLNERLAKIGLRLTLMYKQNKQKQKSVSLRFVSTSGGSMMTVLDTVKKGEQKEYVQFALNDRW